LQEEINQNDDQNVFRVDFPERAKEQATISTFIILGNDAILTEGFYGLNIRHVRGFHGNGFVAHVHGGGSTACNSDILYGTDKATYQQALAVGYSLVNGKEVELQHWEEQQGQMGHQYAQQRRADKLEAAIEEFREMFDISILRQCAADGNEHATLLLSILKGETQNKTL
jgi:hypothetical protein